MTDEKAVAYHEAGHAVAHFALGIPFEKVTIVPDEDRGSLGAIHHPPVNHPDFWECEEDEKNLLIDKYVLNSYIAGLAEEKYTGTYNHDGTGQDRRDAIDYVSRRCGSDDELEAYLNWLFIRARNFVNNPVRWQQIATLAEALLEQKQLSDDQAVMIIRHAGLNYLPTKNNLSIE